MKAPDKKKWEQVMTCQNCKASLVEYMAKSIHNHIRPHLRAGQRVYISGNEERTGYSTFHHENIPDPWLRSNAPEADTLVWLHVYSRLGKNVLVISPDTDTIFIGLPLLFPEKNGIHQN